MRPLACRVAAIVAGLACVGEGDRVVPRTPPDASARASTESARGASGPGASPAASPPAPEARAICAAAAARWRTIHGVTVRELDTLLTDADVIDDPELDTAPPGAVGPRFAACAVESYAANGLDSTLARSPVWPLADWVRFPRLNADGPGGQVQVYQRDWVRCQVADEWDPGDDGDSTYVPTPFYREWTFCWRHGRLVAPADTMYLGG